MLKIIRSLRSYWNKPTYAMLTWTKESHKKYQAQNNKWQQNWDYVQLFISPLIFPVAQVFCLEWLEISRPCGAVFHIPLSIVLVLRFLCSPDLLLLLIGASASSSTYWWVSNSTSKWKEIKKINGKMRIFPMHAFLSESVHPIFNVALQSIDESQSHQVNEKK